MRELMKEAAKIRRQAVKAYLAKRNKQEIKEQRAIIEETKEDIRETLQRAGILLRH